MDAVYTAGQVRDAEAGLLARTREGALMRRAAFGVATYARRMLAGRGRLSGAKVALLAGAGNNGGDALWAGYELRRRGVGVAALLLAPERAHPAGLAALRAAGGRVLDVSADPAAARAAATAADLVLDGIVGISARGPLRPS